MLRSTGCSMIMVVKIAEMTIGTVKEAVTAVAVCSRAEEDTVVGNTEIMTGAACSAARVMNFANSDVWRSRCGMT